MENYQLSVFTCTNLCFVKNIIQMLCIETYYMLYFSYKKVQRGGSCMILHSSSNSFWWNTMNLNCITQWSWFWEKTFSKNKYDCLRVCFDALWRSHFKLEHLKNCPTFVDACFLWLVYLFCKALFFFGFISLHILLNSSPFFLGLEVAQSCLLLGGRRNAHLWWSQKVLRGPRSHTYYYH